MAPRESDPLIGTYDEIYSKDVIADPSKDFKFFGRNTNKLMFALGLLVVAVASAVWKLVETSSSPSSSWDTSSTWETISASDTATGPYVLIQRQVGNTFFDHYDFYEGPDSLGSAGAQVYVGEKRAKELELVDVQEKTTDNGTADNDSRILVQAKITPKESSSSKNTTTAARLESIRLEGKQSFDRGLFVLDVDHLPAGCGVWPAFWMTDEGVWPNHGEIDIIEGINTQSVAKTALHTSEDCDMFAHVPDYAWTGEWDTATGLPDTFTGVPNIINRVQADNCWVMAPHQWANQGCVAASTDEGTIGEGFNEQGGGVYVLEWDPANGYIKSWVFPRPEIPENLQASIDSANAQEEQPSAKTMNRLRKFDPPSDDDSIVHPQPEEWPLPYAYFAIGPRSGCSNDHFQQMRLVLNLAFCGTVAGNRFVKDCPKLAKEFAVFVENTTTTDSVQTCNAFLEAQAPEILEQAYWKIRGVYVYERSEEK